MRTLFIAIVLAGGIAHADPKVVEVWAGPAWRNSTHEDNAGVAMSFGRANRDHSYGWHIDLVVASGVGPKSDANSLRVGWQWGIPISIVTLSPGFMIGIDADSFPGDSGYTDGAIHLFALGATLRATVDLSSTIFLGLGGDGDLRAVTIGNKRGYDGFAYDAIVFVGVRG